jgi:hypothetical protein
MECQTTFRVIQTLTGRLISEFASEVAANLRAKTLNACAGQAFHVEAA